MRGGVGGELEAEKEGSMIYTQYDRDEWDETEIVGRVPDDEARVHVKMVKNGAECIRLIAELTADKALPEIVKALDALTGGGAWK